MGWRERFVIATKVGEIAVTSLRSAASLVGASVAKSASDFASEILPNAESGDSGSPKPSILVQPDLQAPPAGFSTQLPCENVSGKTNVLLSAISREIERQAEASKTASAKSTEVLCSFFNVFIDDFFQDSSNPRRKAAAILKDFFSDYKSLDNSERNNIIDMGLHIMREGEDEGNTIDLLLGKIHPVSDKSEEVCPAPILEQEEAPKASFSKISERLEREDKTKANPTKPQQVQVEASDAPSAPLAVAAQGNQDNPTIQNAFGSTRLLSSGAVAESGLVATEPIAKVVELDAKKETQQVLGGEQRQKEVAQEDEGRQAEEWEAELVLREISQILKDKKSEFEQYSKHLMEEVVNELGKTKHESLKVFARKLSRGSESKNESADEAAIDDADIEKDREKTAASVHVLIIEKLNGSLQGLSNRKNFLQTILSYFEKYKHVIERHPALRSIADELIAVNGLLQLQEPEGNAEDTLKTNVEKVKKINQHVKALNDSLKGGAMVWLVLKKTILSISIKLAQFFGAGVAKLEKKWTQLKIEVDKREGLASVKIMVEKGNNRIEEARQNGYGYRFMPSDGDCSQEREVVFQVSGAKIKAKMGACYFPISSNNPIHGLVISASKAGKFSADQSKRLARSALLSSCAQQSLLLGDNKKNLYNGPVQASWGHI